MARRPWFQYHLSTAIVLMFVASGLLWLNLHPTTVNVFYKRGFPFEMNQTNAGWQTKIYWKQPEDLIYQEGPFLEMPNGFEGEWFIDRICANLLFAVFVLFIIGFACELSIKEQTEIKVMTRRPMFKIHLSTAIFLMFLACVFIWLNLSFWYEESFKLIPGQIETDPVRGWPWSWSTTGINAWSGYTTDTIKFNQLLKDVLFALVSILGITFWLEWRIRRRERQKQERGILT